MHIVIKQNTRKRWRFDLVAGNGTVVLASKPYASERNAREAIKLVQMKVGTCPVREAA